MIETSFVLHVTETQLQLASAKKRGTYWLRSEKSRAHYGLNPPCRLFLPLVGLFQAGTPKWEKDGGLQPWLSLQIEWHKGTLPLSQQQQHQPQGWLPSPHRPASITYLG